MEDPDECTPEGFRSATINKQLFEIAKVDSDPPTYGDESSSHNLGGNDNEWDKTTTISGVVEMSPVDGASGGNTEWYARIPVPPNVEEVPFLYYRIWACNGDNDPQAHNTERAGGGPVSGTSLSYNGGTLGSLITDPYLTQYPIGGGTGVGSAGGRYRDRDYGWVTRSLFAGRVAKPAQLKITAIVNYKNTQRQVTAFMKRDDKTRKPSGILSIQVNTPKMLGE